MKGLTDAENKAYKAKQLEEALGEVNRYFFHEHYGRDGSDEELVMYYIEFGAKKFAERINQPDQLAVA